MIGQLGRLSGRAGQGAGRRAAGQVRPDRRADRGVKTYSGGMRRRLDLAASLVTRPQHPVPRRTDHRPGPAQPDGHLGCGPRARRRRHDGPAHHAVPGRGRPAGRPDRGHRQRPGHRRGHVRAAQGQDRRRAGQRDRRRSSPTSASRPGVLARHADEPPRRDPATRVGRGAGDQRRPPDARRSCAISTRPACCSTTWRSAIPRSTTSSSP